MPAGHIDNPSPPGGSGSGFIPQYKSLFVNPVASNAVDDGDFSTPYITIQGALNAIGAPPTPVSEEDSRDNHVIFIAQGSYDEDLNVPPGRRIALVGFGTVVLGDGIGQWKQSTSPRSITWDLDQKYEDPPALARPALTIGTLGEIPAGTHGFVSYGFIISGSIHPNYLGEQDYTTHELQMFNVYLQGGMSFGLGGEPGDINMYLYRCKIDGDINLPRFANDARLWEADECIFGGSILVYYAGRFRHSEFNGNITFQSRMLRNAVGPIGFYGCEFSGVAMSIGDNNFYLDGASNHWFKTGGGNSLVGATTKVIIDDLVP